MLIPKNPHRIRPRTVIFAVVGAVAGVWILNTKLPRDETTSSLVFRAMGGSLVGILLATEGVRVSLVTASIGALLTTAFPLYACDGSIYWGPMFGAFFGWALGAIASFRPSKPW